jgi:hypothetical protein
MEKRGEPFLLVVPRGLPYAIQRLGHACPVLRPERALLARPSRPGEFHPEPLTDPDVT